MTQQNTLKTVDEIVQEIEDDCWKLLGLVTRSQRLSISQVEVIKKHLLAERKQAEEAIAQAVKQIENKYENCPQCTGLREEFKNELIEEVKKLCTHFPVRESDEFDDGRLSMQREVLEILTTPKQ